MKRVLEALTAIILFLIPSNLFLQVFVSSAYQKSLFIDYLVPKIFLSDLVLLSFIFLYYLWKKPILKTKNIFIPVFFLILLLIIRQFFVVDVFASVEYLFHLVLILLFGGILYFDKDLVKSASVSWGLLTALLFQSGVGLYQFFTQHSVAGYWFLGEPNIQKSYGIVRQTLLGSEKVLPYGTTAHPNVLGGFIALFLLVILHRMLVQKSTSKLFLSLFYTTIPFALITLWLTQSISAWLCFSIGVIFLGYDFIKIFLQKKAPHAVTFSKRNLLLIAVICFVLSPFILSRFLPYEQQNTSISRRIFLNGAGWKMFSENMFLGVGLNQFTAELENYSRSAEAVRFIQPAHHIGILWLAETGLLGLATLMVALFAWLKKAGRVSPLLLSLLPVMVFDHYLLTIQTGVLLLVVALVFFTVEESTQ